MGKDVVRSRAVYRQEDNRLTRDSDGNEPVGDDKLEELLEEGVFVYAVRSTTGGSLIMVTKKDIERRARKLDPEQAIDFNDLPPVTVTKLLAAESIEEMRHPDLIRIDGELHETKSLIDTLDDVAESYESERLYLIESSESAMVLTLI